jgi:hypothetical protein
LATRPRADVLYVDAKELFDELDVLLRSFGHLVPFCDPCCTSLPTFECLILDLHLVEYLLARWKRRQLSAVDDIRNPNLNFLERVQDIQLGQVQRFLSSASSTIRR